MPHLLTLSDDEIILPLRVKREDVSQIKAVKLRADEVPEIDMFQEYLFKRGFISENTWAALVVYCINLSHHYHQQAFDNEEKSLKGSG